MPILPPAGSLQRYVKFSYNSQRISATERHYRIKKWESSASSIDESPDVIFDYFMRRDVRQPRRPVPQCAKLNDKAILLSGSINSPLYICCAESPAARLINPSPVPPARKCALAHRSIIAPLSTMLKRTFCV